MKYRIQRPELSLWTDFLGARAPLELASVKNNNNNNKKKKEKVSNRNNFLSPASTCTHWYTTSLITQF